MQRRSHLIKACLGVVAVFLFNVFASDEGKISITTDPQGVEIWLGDNYIGNSPIIEKKVPTGKYIIKFVDPVQRISQIEQIMVTPNNTVVLDKKMRPKFGTLKVETVPENADVYITMPLGKTPLVNEFINPGKYQLQIKHSDTHYQPLLKEVTVSEGAASSLADTLVREKVLNKKAWLRLGLGAGAIAGFIWGVVENRRQAELDYKDRRDDAKAARVYRTIGVSAGALCVVGFEIVAFF